MGTGSRRIPAGALIALALALLLAGFLLGRRSSPTAPAPATASPPATQEAARDAAPADEPAPTLTPADDAAPTPAPPIETLPAIVPSTVATRAEPPATMDARGQEDIARYFDEADAIEARTKYWSDPQALANSILEQASSGSTAGFDELIRAQRGARDALGRMSVPASCAEHHRRSLAVMADGLGLLERVRNAIASGDLGGLDGLQEQARGLEREAKAIDELARTLRQR